MSIDKHIVHFTKDPNHIDNLISFQAKILSSLSNKDIESIKNSLKINNCKYTSNNIEINVFYTVFNKKHISASGSVLICSNNNINLIKEVNQFIESIVVKNDKRKVLELLTKEKKVVIFSRLGTDKNFRGIGLSKKINNARLDLISNKNINNIFSLSTGEGKISLEKYGFLEVYNSQIDLYNNGNKTNIFLMKKSN